MERADAIRIQPYYIAYFFKKAFKALGGSMARRDGENVKCYEILYLPNTIRQYNSALGFNYSRVCFDKKYVNVEGLKTAHLIALGSPLLDAVASAAIGRLGGALKQGAVLVDNGSSIRLLFIVQDSVLNGERIG